MVIDGNVIYMALYQANYTPKRSDVVRSTDGGKTWESIQGESGPTVAYGGLAIHQGTLYAGGNGEGLWRYSIPGDVSTGGNRSMLPIALSIGSLAPNPTSGQILATISMTKPGDVLVEIFNQIGECIATPVVKYLEAGTQVVSFDIDGIPAGAYYCRIRTPDGSVSRPFIIAR
jgi:hypothetical protein